MTRGFLPDPEEGRHQAEHYDSPGFNVDAFFKCKHKVDKCESRCEQCDLELAEKMKEMRK